MKITMQGVLLRSTDNPPCRRSCDNFASKLPALARRDGTSSPGPESLALCGDLTPLNTCFFLSHVF